MKFIFRFFILAFLFPVYCMHGGAIIIRSAINSDIDSALDLDKRVSMEYSKPLFKNYYTQSLKLIKID